MNSSQSASLKPVSQVVQSQPVSQVVQSQPVSPSSRIRSMIEINNINDLKLENRNLYLTSSLQSLTEQLSIFHIALKYIPRNTQDYEKVKQKVDLLESNLNDIKTQIEANILTKSIIKQKTMIEQLQHKFDEDSQKLIALTDKSKRYREKDVVTNNAPPKKNRSDE